MRSTLSLLASCLMALSLQAETPPSLLVDFDMAEAKENAQGALVLTNSSEVQATSEAPLTITSRSEGGRAYQLSDIGKEDQRDCLTLDPDRNAYFLTNLAPANAPGNDDFTVAFWYKPPSDLSDGILISAGTAEPTWFAQIKTDCKLHLWFNGMPSGEGSGKTIAMQSASLLRPDEWNHIAIVFDRNNAIIIYLNGDLDITGPSISEQTAPLSPRLMIGGPNPYAGGKLGRMQIFRGKLGADEISKLASP